jgi:hypothetical protein
MDELAGTNRVGHFLIHGIVLPLAVAVFFNLTKTSWRSGRWTRWRISQRAGQTT